MEYQQNECNHKNLSKKIADRMVENLINAGFKQFNPLSKPKKGDEIQWTGQTNHKKGVRLDKDTILIVYETVGFHDTRLLIVKQLTDKLKGCYYWNHTDIDSLGDGEISNIVQLDDKMIKLEFGEDYFGEMAIKRIFSSVKKIKDPGFFGKNATYSAINKKLDLKVRLWEYTSDGCLLDYFVNNDFIEGVSKDVIEISEMI